MESATLTLKHNHINSQVVSLRHMIMYLSKYHASKLNQKWKEQQQINM